MIWWNKLYKKLNSKRKPHKTFYFFRPRTANTCRLDFYSVNEPRHPFPKINVNYKLPL